MKNSFYIDLQRFMLIPTKFPLTQNDGHCRGAAQHNVSASSEYVVFQSRDRCNECSHEIGGVGAGVLKRAGDGIHVMPTSGKELTVAVKGFA